MRLTPKVRNWIYFNIRKFHTDDLYLKTLNANIINSDFKQILNHSSNTEELEANLDIPSFNKEFGFYRKDGLYFLYPSLKNQVMSLLDCWPEISSIYSSYYESSENDFESHEDEPFQEKLISGRKKKIKRKSFGNRANISSDFRSEPSATIHRHVMTSNRSIRVSFSYELNDFRKRAISELKKIEKRKKLNSYFIQTDLKSFFHCLNLEILQRHLPKNIPKCREWLKKVYSTNPDGGLPIGWILSGFLADLLMRKFSSQIEKNEIQIKRNLQLGHLTMLNYVDDLIFFVSSKNKLEKKTFLEDFCKTIQIEINNFFDSDSIKIHSSESPKTKFVELRESSLALMNSNWHDSTFASYGKRETPNKKWSMLDEFLLPADNDLFLNERVQFYNNLKNLRAKVESGEIQSKNEFVPLLDKILYKMSLDRKYLYTIVDTVFLYGSKRNDLEELVSKLWHALQKLEDITCLELINFLNCLHSYIKKKKHHIKIFHDYASKVKSFVSNNQRFKIYNDEQLLNSFLTKFYIAHPELINTLCDHANKDDLYFYKSSCAALNYSEILVNSKIISVRGNPFLFFEVSKNLTQNSNSLDALKYLKIMVKNIESHDGKKRFILEYLENFSYEFVPLFSRRQLEYLLKFLHEFEIHGPVIDEIENILVNYEYLKSFYSSIDVPHVTRFVVGTKVTGSKKLDKNFEAFRSLLFLKHYKPYAFYREILGLVVLACSNYKDALRVILYQYRTTDSFVFFSWNALPTSYNASSHILLGVVKKILASSTTSFNVNTSPIAIDLVEEIQSLHSLGGSKVKKINLKEFEEYMSFDTLSFDQSNQIKLMIANVEIDIHKDFDARNDLKFTQSSLERVHEDVNRAILKAIKYDCDVICFPELTLPEKYLEYYYNLAGENDLIIIGGTEYELISSDEIANATVICFPTSRGANALGKKYHTYKQYKNFISIAEFAALKDIKSKKEFYEGSELLLFESLKVHNFSILTCSDFLSLENKYLLQGQVQTIFVPAMNFDNTTYHHVSQSAIREMYCICVVCNNSFMGASHICAPFRDEWRRTLFRIEGKSLPKTHTITINPSVIKELQEIGMDKKLQFDKNERLLSSTENEKLKSFKQVPPDWFKVGKKTS